MAIHRVRERRGIGQGAGARALILTRTMQPILIGMDLPLTPCWCEPAAAFQLNAVVKSPSNEPGNQENVSCRRFPWKSSGAALLQIRTDLAVAGKKVSRSLQSCIVHQAALMGPRLGGMNNRLLRWGAVLWVAAIGLVVYYRSNSAEIDA